MAGTTQVAGGLTGALSGAAAGTAIMPGVGTVIGGVIGALGGVLGSGGASAPQGAQYTPVDPAAVAKQTVSGNLQNFGSAAQLAAQTNQFNQQQAQSLLEQAMPGFKATQSKLMSQINDDLANQDKLPQDVQDQIARYAAEKGVTRGTAGNFNGFNLVKDFGFNLIDWKNASRARALNTLSTVYGMTPRVNPMSPMAMMVDPNTAISVQSQNNQMAYGSQQAMYNAQAAASNYNAMMGNGLMQNFITQLPNAAKNIQGKLSAAPSNPQNGGINPATGDNW